MPEQFLFTKEKGSLFNVKVWMKQSPHLYSILIRRKCPLYVLKIYGCIIIILMLIRSCLYAGENIRRKRRLSSFQIIILGFAGVILLGALLLMLPISTTAGGVTPFNETLFTATSAVCVTGLVVCRIQAVIGQPLGKRSF